MKILLATFTTLLIAVTASSGQSTSKLITETYTSDGRVIILNCDKKADKAHFRLQISQNADSGPISYDNVDLRIYDDESREVEIKPESVAEFIAVGNGKWLAASGFYIANLQSGRVPLTAVFSIRGMNHTFTFKLAE